MFQFINPKQTKYPTAYTMYNTVTAPSAEATSSLALLPLRSACANGLRPQPTTHWGRAFPLVMVLLGFGLSNTALATTTDNSLPIISNPVGLTSTAILDGTQLFSTGITEQPAATSVVCTSANVTVFISATTTGTISKWYKGVNELSGQTSATLTLTNVQPGDTDGYTAQVFSTNAPPLFSSIFNLIVRQNVGITVQPAAGTLVCSGADITQTVSVSGTGPYGFQWIKGSTNIASQTTATLSLLNVQQIPDADGYTLNVFGLCNSLLSNTFSLSINQAVAITVQPVAMSVVCVGSTVTATVSVSGSGPFAYEWIKGQTLITSQTTATLSLTNVQPGDKDSYFVRVFTSCNNVLSSPFALTVVSGGVTLGAIPSGGAFCENTLTQVVVSATVTGSSATFKWYRNGLEVSGQTSATLTLMNVQAAQAGNYVLIATSACSSATSTAYNLTVGTVNPNVVITFPNGSTVVVNGAVPTITIPAGTQPTMLITGGALYDWTVIMDRINGYEIRAVESNTTGFFTIKQTGPYKLKVTGANGCTRRVEGVIVVGQ